ncbi:copper amine oxidase [Bacillus sp. FJAT-42376]|uniref:copper amine oxidase n=1 Tax=Bacillus sp. FJAT-42376 TaxID=2014076 RepID=UPI000F4F826A|nr:copper amine oxidase [Bacillus sp. FJAT-42376]AZB44702.1 copper amine oxidase [Bacillus sp. FJAT-42376]
MKMKRTWMAVPLSVALLVPGAGVASAAGHEGHSMNHSGNMKMSAEVSNPAIDLRANLDAILSEHAYLAVVAMQKGIDGKEDFDAAAAQLNENTEALSAAVGSVYGEEAGNAFKEIWGSHIGYFVDYVKATAAKDEDGKMQAKKELDEYRSEQAQFLDKATGGRLKAKDLEEGLKMHVNELITAFDSYTEKDYDTTYSTVRESIKHMYGVGKALSWAITDQFPDKFEGKSVDTPAANLRADLNYLFSEHAALAALAMQKGIDGTEDFDEAAAALNENTNDLSASVASVYGKEGGEQYKKIWNSHIGYLVDYVKATGAKDEKAKEMALKELDEYRAEQAKFLDTATEGRLKAADLEKGLEVHIDQLLNAFNSYNEKDYDMAYDSIHEAYNHMFGVGLGVSGAIVDQYPDKFMGKMPTEMPKTGMGGTSETGNSSLIWMSVSGFILALAAIATIVRKRRLN